MRLGLVITDEAHADLVGELGARALARDWEVRCFMTDTGVRALANDKVRMLINDPHAETAVCEHSIERYGTGGPDLASLEAILIVGGQYQNAELARESDRVLVF